MITIDKLPSWHTLVLKEAVQRAPRVFEMVTRRLINNVKYHA